MKPNGWVEFGADGVLRTSLCTGGRGHWERHSNDEMVLTFGKCHHICCLLHKAKGQPQMFEVRERVLVLVLTVLLVMKDRPPVRKTKTNTRGRLDME